MFDILAFLSGKSMWAWGTLGLLLLAAEFVVPGMYLFWLGMGALLVGVVAGFVPDMGIAGEVILFALSAAVFVYVGRRVMYGRADEPEDTNLNERGKSYIGKVYKVSVAIENGHGKVQVGDSHWSAEGPDCAVGETVKVVAVEGILMRVERV